MSPADQCLDPGNLVPIASKAVIDGLIDQKQFVVRKCLTQFVGAHGGGLGEPAGAGSEPIAVPVAFGLIHGCFSLAHQVGSIGLFAAGERSNPNAGGEPQQHASHRQGSIEPLQQRFRKRGGAGSRCRSFQQNGKYVSPHVK